MKKLILIALIALSVTACGSSSAPQGPVAQVDTDSDDYYSYECRDDVYLADDVIWRVCDEKLGEEHTVVRHLVTLKEGVVWYDYTDVNAEAPEYVLGDLRDDNVCVDFEVDHDTVFRTCDGPNRTFHKLTVQGVDVWERTQAN